MEHITRGVILLSLIDSLKRKGSWCGETHIQKSVYFLQSLGRVELNYDFIFYKHGPFSFDLRDEITTFVADGLLEVVAKPEPYGPSIELTVYGSDLIKHNYDTGSETENAIQFIVDHFAEFGVAKLEKLSTALYVKEKNKKDQAISTDALAQQIHELKSHIGIDEAKKDIEEIESLLSQARERGLYQ